MTDYDPKSWINDPLVKNDVRIANNEMAHWFAIQRRLARAKLVEAEKRMELLLEHDQNKTLAQTEVDTAKFMVEYWHQEFLKWIEDVSEALKRAGAY